MKQLILGAISLFGVGIITLYKIEEIYFLGTLLAIFSLVNLIWGCIKIVAVLDEVEEDKKQSHE